MAPCLRFEISTQLPEAYAALIWDVFFVQRGRGISLDAHFPWIQRPEGSARFATLSDGDTLLAGLTLRPCDASTSAIGLVCVHPDHRGQGLANQLLEAALAELDRGGQAATTLWTGKPAVYQRHGFVLHDCGLQGQVTDWPARRTAAVPVRSWPDAEVVHRGLPSYAHHGLRVEMGCTELVLLLDPLGVMLAEWQGDDTQVIELLSAVMPARWRLNALEGDSLPAALRAYGASLTLSPQALQMWRVHPRGALPDLPRLRLLDRI